MTRAILVTGGTGFIGAALVRRLVGLGHRVRVLDDNSRGANRRLEGVLDKVELVIGDVRDLESVRGAVRGMDTVMHLASVNGTEFFYTKPELVLDVGVRGMLAVLDACRAEGVRDLLYASSSEVYQTPPMVPTPETVPLSIPDPLNPRYCYGGQKLIGELLAINYGRTGFDRVAIFRPHNVYGPDMGWEHVLPQFALRMADAVDKHPEGIIDFPIQGDGSQTRAFVHIDDFTDGLVHILERGRHLEIYHIGTTEERTMAEAAQAVASHLGREIRLVPQPAPAGGTPRRAPTIDKLAALGYRPRIRLEDGLPSLVDWYVANRDKRPQT